MDKLGSLVAGSVAGGIARWLLSEALSKAGDGRFPYGTLAVNLSGCLIIGALHGLSDTRFPLSAQARMLLIVGFCGAYTTFSSWILETSALVDKGNISGACGYVLVSVMAGFLLFRTGASLPKGMASLARSSPAETLGR